MHCARKEPFIVTPRDEVRVQASPQGELAAACRYFTQGLSDDDPGRKDMLMDIATEELSQYERHLNFIHLHREAPGNSVMFPDG
ncbi:manganese catalase family protein, partial [Klebsiella pneumoniae]|uniref:manganese catalase family protein n=1 Tax=Klebsiella pneumoniae TaxID=573 RepID=UPI003F7ABA49